MYYAYWNLGVHILQVHNMGIKLNFAVLSIQMLHKL